MNYNHISHYHCWDQKSPACGIPLEKHTQCCLCDKQTPSEGKECEHEDRPMTEGEAEIAKGLNEFLASPSTPSSTEGCTEGGETPWEVEFDEQLLREEWMNDEQIQDEVFSGDSSRLVADWWLKALHQAELNWLTAQIERGEGMKYRKWRHLTAGDFYGCDFCGAMGDCKCPTAIRHALTDFLTPLIERKKEVEKLLEVTQ